MTTSTPAKTGYAPIQIILHWLIAAIILFQIVFGESMVTATDAAEEGTALSATDAILASAHYWAGISILLLVAVRLVIRLRTGAPEPIDGNPILVFLAKATHWAFYALLVAVPISGLVTVYINPEVGDIHQLAKPAFVILIGLHAAAALFHQFILRDGTLRRMLVPAK